MLAVEPPALPLPPVLSPPTDFQPFPGPSPAFASVFAALALILMLAITIRAYRGVDEEPGPIDLPAARHWMDNCRTDWQMVVRVLPDPGGGDAPVLRVRWLDMDLNGFLQFLKSDAERCWPAGADEVPLEILLVVDRGTRWGPVQRVLDGLATLSPGLNRVAFAVRPASSTGGRSP